MAQRNTCSRLCGFDFINCAALTHFYGVDGVLDGVISDMDACNFDSGHPVGMQIAWSDGMVQVSELPAV